MSQRMRSAYSLRCWDFYGNKTLCNATKSQDKSDSVVDRNEKVFGLLECTPLYIYNGVLITFFFNCNRNDPVLMIVFFFNS